MTWTDLWITWLTNGREELETVFYFVLQNCRLLSRNTSLDTLTKTVSSTSHLWVVQAVLFLILIIVLKLFISGLTRTSTEIKSELPRNLFDMAKIAHRPEICDKLIKVLVDLKPFDANQRMPKSNTADNEMSFFLCSCFSGSERMLRFLLCNGGDIHDRTKWNDSPLHLVTFALSGNKNEDFGAIDILLGAGCDINSKNWIGNTPLCVAASHGNIKLIRYLLQKGADPSIANNKGIYPIDFANNADNKDAADLLVFDFPNPYVWDVIEPHTPPRIKLGLQSPSKQHLADSSFTRRPGRRDKHIRY